MQTNKKILGFTGLLASGKGTASEYLKDKHGARTYRFSSMLRDALDRFHLPHTRDNLVKLSEIMRETYGESLMASTMAKDVENDSAKLIVIDGIRRPADIEFLSKLKDFTLVKIFADPKVRYDRLILRSENQDDQTKTYEQFLEDHKRSTELSILEVEKLADKVVDNNGNFDNLYAQLDALVS